MPRQDFVLCCMLFHYGRECSPALHLPAIPDNPRLTVTPCGKDLCVDLQPPVENFRKIYEDLKYKLKVQSTNKQFEKVLCRPKYFFLNFDLSSCTVCDISSSGAPCAGLRRCESECGVSECPVV